MTRPAKRLDKQTSFQACDAMQLDEESVGDMLTSELEFGELQQIARKLMTFNTWHGTCGALENVLDLYQLLSPDDVTFQEPLWPTKPSA